MIRLSSQDLTNICTAIQPLVPAGSCRLYLFGSRVDSSKRGGDIDLLLVTKTADEALDLKKNRLNLSVSLTKHLGERRVDLTIATQDDLVKDPFLAAIWPQVVLIKEF